MRLLPFLPTPARSLAPACRLALAASALAASPAGATTYDAVKNFSTAHNTETATWSYRSGDAGGHDGNYTPLTDVGTFAVVRRGQSATLPDWDTAANGFTVPLFAANKPAGQVSFSSNGQAIRLPGATLLYHPGFGVPAILSFRAKAAGTATVKFTFSHLDWSCGANGAGIDWSVEKNSGGAALASGHLLSTDAKHIATSGPHTISVALAPTDRINFILDGVANPPNCASTGLIATISLP